MRLPARVRGMVVGLGLALAGGTTAPAPQGDAAAAGIVMGFTDAGDGTPADTSKMLTVSEPGFVLSELEFVT